MRVLVVGAYGLVGAGVTARLLRDGHAVIGVGRDTASAKRRLAVAPCPGRSGGRLRRRTARRAA
jgi:nucleoside-diphosphate-sugar epimerase